MALTVWSLSAVVVDQLRLITCFKDDNPLNSMYCALLATPGGSLRPLASPARTARGTGFPQSGEGAVVTALLLLRGAVMLWALHTPVFTLEPHGVECE